MTHLQVLCADAEGQPADLLHHGPPLVSRGQLAVLPSEQPRGPHPGLAACRCGCSAACAVGAEEGGDGVGGDLALGRRVA